MPFAELVARVERLARRAPCPRPRPAGAPAPSTTAGARFAAPGGGRARPGVAAVAGRPRPAPATASSPRPRCWRRAATRPSLVQPLRGARLASTGATLTLEVAADFVALRRACTWTSTASWPRKAVGAAPEGRGDRGRGRPPAEEAAARSESAGPAKRERLMKEAAREPAVQEALDLFGGSVVDVRDAKS